jgi:cytochrome o ubiquinol oxidase operon protein cyoD
MNDKQPLIGHFHPPHGSVRGYIFGFGASLALTMAAYLIAVTDGATRKWAIASIGALAAVQCVIQLVWFLHLGREFRPRWKLMVFSFMVSIILIVIIGSVWIMHSLNYRMMQSPTQLQQYVKGQDGL